MRKSELIAGGLVILVGIVIGSSAITTIDSGYTGVRVMLGKVSEDILNEGLNFKVPFFEKVVKMNNKVKNVQVSGTGATSDKQDVTFNVDINYYLDPDHSAYVYKKVGKNYEDIVLVPALQDAVKVNMSKYNAETLISDRNGLADDIKNYISDAMVDYGIIVTKTNVSNLEFSEVYRTAIEEKQVLEEEVKKAELEKQKAQVEAETEKVKAEAKANANEILTQSIDDKILQQQFIEKWDGKLPVVNGNEGNIFDVSSLIGNQQ